MSDMCSVDQVVSILETDMAAVLEDYLTAPNYCFMVAVTLADCLEILGYDAEVRAVRANCHPVDRNSTEIGGVWDTTSASRPKRVILKVEDRFIDVTSRQIGPGFPWVMEVKVDRTPKTINGFECRYQDMGRYVPSPTRYKKCFSGDLYTMARAIFVAATKRMSTLGLTKSAIQELA